MDAELSQDIKTIKDPGLRLLVRWLFILLIGSGTVIGFLYKGSSGAKAQDLTDCRSEVKYWRGKSDSLELSAYMKSEDQRLRLQEKERLFDSIIHLGKSLNIVK